MRPHLASPRRNLLPQVHPHRFTAHHLALAAARADGPNFDLGVFVADNERAHAAGEGPPRAWMLAFAEDAARMTPPERLAGIEASRAYLARAKASGSAPATDEEILARGQHDPGFRVLWVAGAVELMLRSAQASSIARPLGYACGDALAVEFRPAALARLGWNPGHDAQPFPLAREPGSETEAVFLEFGHWPKLARGITAPRAIADAWADDVRASLRAVGAGGAYDAIVPPGFDLAASSPYRAVAVVVAPRGAAPVSSASR